MFSVICCCLVGVCCVRVARIDWPYLCQAAHDNRPTVEPFDFGTPTPPRIKSNFDFVTVPNV